MQRTYWNKEKCAVEALKYNTKTEFNKACVGAYTHALKHGFYNPQNEMFLKIKTKRSVLQNEMFFFGFPPHNTKKRLGLSGAFLFSQNSTWV